MSIKNAVTTTAKTAKTVYLTVIHVMALYLVCSFIFELKLTWVTPEAVQYVRTLPAAPPAPQLMAENHKGRK